MVWKRADATSDRVSGIYAPASGSRANHGKYPAISPLVDLQGPGLRSCLARQQEEYEEYLVGKTVDETPCYLARLGQRTSSTECRLFDEGMISDPNTPLVQIGIVVAVAFRSYYF